MTRILIVDDHPLFRRGLAALVRVVLDFEFVDEAKNGEEVITLAALP